MQMPALRLPQLRVSFAWLGALGGRITILYMGYTAILFIVFLLMTFPHDLLIRRLLSGADRGPVGIEFNKADFAWWKGYELSGMRIGARDDDSKPPLLECSHFWIRPAFTQLLRGNPYAVAVSADLYGGTAQGDLSLVDTNLVGNLQWQDLNVGRYRALTTLLDEGQLTGRLSGQISVQSRGMNLSTSQVSGDMSLDGAALTAAKVQSFTVPDLHMRQTKLKFSVKAGRLELAELKAAGDVNADVSGNIQLRDPIQDSQLNLKATIETGLSTPDAIKGLVTLIPRPPGSKLDAPLTIGGTLGHPRVR